MIFTTLVHIYGIFFGRDVPHPRSLQRNHDDPSNCCSSWSWRKYWQHLPVSFAYHMGVALGVFRNRLDNALRRCDQAMQHAVCVAFSWALSKGCIKFTALNAVVNSYFAVQVFRQNDRRRWIPIGMCTLLYTLPMLFPVNRQNAANYAVAAASMTVGGLAAFAPWDQFWHPQGMGSLVRVSRGSLLLRKGTS